MKKIYTLAAAALISFGANAQTYDLSINFTSLTDGETYTDASNDISVSFTNEGPSTIAAGDSVYLSYTRDGVAVFVTDINTTGVQYLPLAEDLAPGASIGPFGPTEIGFPSGFNENICAIVYGVGAASVESDFADDTDASNNTKCVTFDVTEGFDASIEDLENSLGQVYVSGEELIVVNENFVSTEAANIKMVNMAGQTVFVESFQFAQGTSTFAVGHLNRGIYIVAIEVEGNVVTRKISIQ